MAGVSFTLLDIPVAAANVLKLRADKLPRATFRFMNLGLANAVLKIQESDDANTGFVDISGATQTIKPGGEADISVVSHKAYLMVVGSGGTYGKLDVFYRGAAILYGNLDMMVIGKTGFTTD